jgi:hypothetical protein
MYKLTSNGVVVEGLVIPADPGNRHWQEYLAWVAAGNQADPADVPTPAQVAREAEIAGAGPMARAWFAGQQAAIDFVRLDPAAQGAQIDAMNLAQLKVVVKFLAVAVSVLVKREFL